MESYATFSDLKICTHFHFKWLLDIFCITMLLDCFKWKLDFQFWSNIDSHSINQTQLFNWKKKLSEINWKSFHRKWYWHRVQQRKMQLVYKNVTFFHLFFLKKMPRTFHQAEMQLGEINVACFHFSILRVDARKLFIKIKQKRSNMHQRKSRD